MSVARALVVEDDAAWQAILSEALTDLGLQVDVAGSLSEALRLLRGEGYHVATVDLALAGSDYRDQGGLTVLETLRRAQPGCAVLLLTGYATVEIAVRAMREFSALTVIEKDRFQRRAFLDLIGQALESRLAPGSLGSLTEREREVLTLLARGLTNQEIAERLVISSNTVKRHLKSIFEKLGTHTRSAAVALAISAGLVD